MPATPRYHHILLVIKPNLPSTFNVLHISSRRDDDIEQRLAVVERGARGARLELAALSQRQKKADERGQELGHKTDQLEQCFALLEAHVMAHSEVRACDLATRSCAAPSCDVWANPVAIWHMRRCDSKVACYIFIVYAAPACRYFYFSYSYRDGCTLLLQHAAWRLHRAAAPCHIKGTALLSVQHPVS